MKDLLIRNFISFHLNFNERLQVELLLSKQELFNALVDKINKDIVENIDQDVEIIEIDLVSSNTLNVKGRAGVMGIKKDFVVHSFIDVDKEKDVIALQVKEIKVEGGFLVQKGFGLIENKIREKIESVARLELQKTLKSLKPSFPIPGSKEKIDLSINALDLETLTLVPNDLELLITVAVKQADVSLKSSNPTT